MGKNAHKLKNYLCIFFPLIYFSQFSINIDVSHIQLVQLLKVRQSRNGSFKLMIPRKKQRKNSFFLPNSTNGQLISKANCQAVNSSKKRTNEFIFTTMQHVFVRFLKKLKSTKRHFEINWPLSQILSFLFWKNSRIPESPFEINWPLIWDTFKIMGLFVLSCSRDPATNSKTTNLELKYKLAG